MLLAWQIFDAGRLTFGLQSPIDAATALCVLLPFFIWSPLTRRSWILLVVECFLALSIVLTGTRSAVLVELVIYLAWLLCSTPRKYVHFAFRCAVIIAAAFLIPQVKRLHSVDDSIGHRADIYLSWPVMAKAALFKGISDPGLFYSNWLQPTTRSYLYNGLHCEPMRLALEYGVVPSLLVFSLLAAIYFRIGISASTRPSFWRRIYISSIGLWVISFFNNTFTVPYFFAYIIISTTIVLLVFYRDLRWNVLLWALGVLVISMASVFLPSAPSIRSFPWGVEYGNAGRTVSVLVDTTILGNPYGCTLRRLYSGEVRLQAVENIKQLSSFPHCDEVIAFGNTPLQLNITPVENFTLYHPYFPPELLQGLHVTKVIVPIFDEMGLNERWQGYCTANKIDLVSEGGLCIGN